jgi:hypothetical protein
MKGSFVQSRPPAHPAAALVRGFGDWRRGHPGTVTMAGLLAFASPVTLFTGALSVMAAPDSVQVLTLGSWWLLYAVQFWALLLLAGHAGERLVRGNPRLAAATWLVLACAIAASVNVTTSGRAVILIEQGVVQSVRIMQLYSFLLSLILALLYFAHLGRSRTHGAAAGRLAAAQSMQREARRRMAQARLQAVQARIDPALLFGMLEAVRVAYLTDTARAERVLDELIAFLRACLPRLRGEASSVSREAELARAYVRLQFLAHAEEGAMALEVSDAARHARFPPGVLLPLLADAFATYTGQCRLRAAVRDGACELVLVLPAPPAPATLQRVRALLDEVYGPAARLVHRAGVGTAILTLEVPHEPA